MSQKLPIVAIQTENGFFIAHETMVTEPSHYQQRGLSTYYFDGVKGQNTFLPNWYKIEKVPERVYQMVGQPNINYRYELIDKSLESEKFRAVLIRDEIASLKDYDWTWKEEYRPLRSLYEEKFDTQPPKEVDEIFEFKIILVVDNIKEYADFDYVANNCHWHDDPKLHVTSKSISHQIIDKIVFPPPVLPSLPCKLSSFDSYGIIREFVKNNINPRVAEITSDYKFCFTVKKKIPLAKPYKSTWENKKNNGKSYKPPKYNQKMVQDKSIQVFEMTNAVDKYQGYTVIEGFEGDNQEDLKNNIDTFLEELITKINEPLKECECCNGIGVVENK